MHIGRVKEFMLKHNQEELSAINEEQKRLFGIKGRRRGDDKEPELMSSRDFPWGIRCKKIRGDEPSRKTHTSCETCMKHIVCMLNACESARVAKEAARAAEEEARKRAAEEAARAAERARAAENVMSQFADLLSVDPSALAEAVRRLKAQQNDPECSVTSESFRTAQEDGHPTTPPNIEESSK
jgi:DNA primase large subunit